LIDGHEQLKLNTPFTGSAYWIDNPLISNFFKTLHSFSKFGASILHFPWFSCLSLAKSPTAQQTRALAMWWKPAMEAICYYVTKTKFFINASSIKGRISNLNDFPHSPKGSAKVDLKGRLRWTEIEMSDGVLQAKG
jgi:hypothetical protein